MFGHNTLSKTGVILPLSALVIIILGYFVNCCNIMCFFVKTDLLRFLFRMVETTLPQNPRMTKRGQINPTLQVPYYLLM